MKSQEFICLSLCHFYLKSLSVALWDSFSAGLLVDTSGTATLSGSSKFPGRCGFNDFILYALISFPDEYAWTICHPVSWLLMINDCREIIEGRIKYQVQKYKRIEVCVSVILVC